MNDFAKVRIQEGYPVAYELYVKTRSLTRNRARQQGLDNLWEILGRQHVAKSTDFTIKTVGTQTSALVGPTEQTIRNANGADYRAIIEAFAKESGGVTKGRLRRAESEEETTLSSIVNRGARHAVRLMMQENKSLRNENNLLKQLIARDAPPIETAPPVSPIKVPTLSASKTDALREFISPKTMQVRGSTVNVHGAIDDASGEEIAPVGFYAALKDLIG